LGVIRGQRSVLARLSKALQGFELLYEALNGLMDTKVSWELFKDRKVSLQGFQRL
jgi:hypothetical protein